MRRKACYLLCAFLMVSLFAPGAGIPDAKGAAVGDCYVTVDPSCANGTLPVARVNITKRSKNEYLFLPGAWDSDRLILYLKQSEKEAHTLSLDGQDPVPLTDDAQNVAFSHGSLTIVRRASGKVLHRLHAMQGSAIPSLFIQTESGTVSHIHKSRETREPAQMVMYAGDGSVLYRGGLSEIKTRGNTTFGYPKKPYQIKLESKADLLGTGEAKTWILLADYLDSSLMRNRITLDMARYAKMQYAIASQSVASHGITTSTKSSPNFGPRWRNCTMSGFGLPCRF